MRVWTLLIIILLFTVGCQEEVRTDILEQTCVGNTEVPLKCWKFEPGDYYDEYKFILEERDPVVINESSMKITDNCTLDKIKSGKYHTLVFDCDPFLNKDLNGTLEFDYEFLGSNRHMIIKYTRIFGTYDPIYDRKPLSEDDW